MRKIYKYLSIFKVSFKDSTVYIFDLLLSNLFLLLIVFIMMNIWITIFSSNGDKIIEGFTISQMIWYVFITELIITSVPSIIRDIGGLVQRGDLVNFINKPYSFIYYSLFDYYGKIFPVVFTKMIVAGTVVYLWTWYMPISFITLMPFFLGLFLAITLMFFISLFLGLLGFYFEDVSSLHFITYKLLFVFGGILFPLEIYPDSWQWIFFYLPFDEILYLFAKSFVIFDPNLIYDLFLAQIVWVIIFMILSKILYHFISKNISLNGG